MEQQRCRNWKELKLLINERYPEMSRRLQQVAQFVLDNPKTVAFETIAVIADDIGVPPSTLIRFSSSLDFKGFNDLKEVIKADVLASNLNYGRRIDLLADQMDWDSDTLLSKLVSANCFALSDMEANIAAADIKQATDLLADAKNIFVLGNGRAYSVATYFYYALNHAGARTFLLNGGGGMHQEEVNNIDRSDVLIAISYSPYTSNTLSLVESVAKRQVPVIALTDNMLSPLSTVSSVSLNAEEGEVDGFRSLSVSMLLAQVLALSLADKKR